MGFIFDLLTAPVLGPIRGLHWMAEQVAEQVEKELSDDEERIRAELAQLQWSYELDEVAEEDHAQREAALLKRLSALRETEAE